MRPFFNYVHCIPTKNIIGVEVGVKEGINAVDVLANLTNLKQLYLVDRWKAYTPAEALPTECKVGYLDQTVFDGWKTTAYIEISKYPQAFILEMDSTDAVQYLQDQKVVVDFIYIDAAHKYTPVIRDCRNWSKILVKGGVLGGHDYNNPNAPHVAKAAKNFAAECGKKLYYSGEDWWVTLD